MSIKGNEVDAVFMSALIQHGLHDTLVREKILEYLSNLAESRKPKEDSWKRVYEQILTDWQFTPAKPLRDRDGMDIQFDGLVYPYLRVDFSFDKRIAVVECWATREKRIWMQEHSGWTQKVYRSTFCCDSLGDAIDQGLGRKQEIRTVWDKFKEDYS